MSEPAPPRPSGLRFASGHPFGALRGYRSSSGMGDGSSLSSGTCRSSCDFVCASVSVSATSTAASYFKADPLTSTTRVFLISCGWHMFMLAFECLQSLTCVVLMCKKFL